MKSIKDALLLVLLLVLGGSFAGIWEDSAATRARQRPEIAVIANVFNRDPVDGPLNDDCRPDNGLLWINRSASPSLWLCTSRNGWTKIGP